MTKPCREPGCDRLKWKGKHRCYWHHLLSQPMPVQVEAARIRLSEIAEEDRVKRLSSDHWPAGMRFCAGCQYMVPLFYTTGSRCKACASAASHASRTKATYGLSQEDYQRLWDAQDGRCAICRRRPIARRLAVDHEHSTGLVRGLCCSGTDFSCNYNVLGAIEAGEGGGVKTAWRLLCYLIKSPAAKLGITATANEGLDNASE